MLAALRNAFRRLIGTREATTNGPEGVGRAGQASDALTTPAGDESLSLVALRGRVAALESDFTDVLQEWVRTREQWIRYLKRQGAIRAREVSADPLDELEEPDENQLDLEVFRAKFGR